MTSPATASSETAQLTGSVANAELARLTRARVQSIHAQGANTNSDLIAAVQEAALSIAQRDCFCGSLNGPGESATGDSDSLRWASAARSSTGRVCAGERADADIRCSSKLGLM